MSCPLPINMCPPTWYLPTCHISTNIGTPKFDLLLLRSSQPPLIQKKLGVFWSIDHSIPFVWCKSQELQCLNHTFLSFRYSALWQWSLWSCYSHSLSNIINIREHLKPTPKACRLHELSWICSIGWCLCWCCCYLSSSSRSLNSYYHVYFSRPRSSFPLV